MRILGIETSCDETAISLIETTSESESKISFKVLGNALYSQTKIHEKYGGVFPTLAKREHAKNLVPLFLEVLKQSKLLVPKLIKKTDSKKNPSIPKILEREPEMLKAFEENIAHIVKPPIDFIAVTRGPGLEPALWVGINFAKALQTLWDVPILPINHMEGHILISLIKKGAEIGSDWQIYTIQKPKFPSLALLVSGGHTELVQIKELQNYEIIGKTLDDAAGEAFDKAARILGLPYPGGPEISKLAEMWRLEQKAKKIDGHQELSVKLPRPMIHSKDLNFSFSGLKTALLYTVKKIPALTDTHKRMLACEFEDAVVETLISKLKKALKQTGARSLVIGGGVIANKRLRKEAEKLAKENNVELFTPEIQHSTDNSLMIAIAGAVRSILSKNYLANQNNPSDIEAYGNWQISDQ